MSSRLPSIEGMQGFFGGPVTEWSPELWDSSNSGSEGQVYGADNGAVFLRSGNLVFIAGRLQMTSLGTLTGTDTATIGNLPYTAISGVSFPLASNAYFGLALPSAGLSIEANVAANSNEIVLRICETTQGSFNLTVSEVSATGDIWFSGLYITKDDF